MNLNEKRKSIGLASTILSLLLATAAIQTAGAVTVYPGEKALKINGLNYPNWYNTDQTNYALSDFQSLGAGWVSAGFNWGDIQPNGPSDWNWTFVDSQISAMNSHGLKMMGHLTFPTPAWARPSGSNIETLPTDITSWANFCSEAAKRYAPQGVHVWEIFNEPIFHNTSSAYGPILRAAYQAIKALDPGAEILVGGNPLDYMYGGSGVQWLKDLYDMGYGQYFTAVGAHPYDYNTLPSNGGNWAYMEGNSFSMRNVMTANGDSAKKIWVTEYGYASCNPKNPSWTEDTEAQYLTNAYTTLQSKSWAGPLFFYSYRDDSRSTPTVENCFGLVHFSDFSPKKAYYAFKQVPNPSPAANAPVLDMTPPMASITSPANGATVAHRSKVTVTVAASANVGVKDVKIYVNGSLICDPTSAPYSCTFSTSYHHGASYRIGTTAYDAAGNSASAPSVTIKNN